MVTSELVGRRRELAELAGLVERHRLATITGGPGMGKTRLALELAAQLAPRYDGGVWLVALGPVTDPAEVPEVVASTLGLPHDPHVDAVQSVAAHLRQRPTLVVLDGCEHLVDACATLVDRLLHASATATVLATSREPLNVVGEHVWRVRSLSLPPPGEAEGLAASATGSEAVALFCARASAVDPGFSLTAEVAVDVADICRRLDGVPLALELAAGQLATRSLGEVAEHLDRPLEVLTGGDSSPFHRHSSLRAALDWSHDLLRAPEATVLRRLSVFRGGATLEAIEDVCSDEDLPLPHIVSALGGLVVASLAEADLQRAPSRYHLLEPVRAYAEERLAEAGEAERFRLRHARWYLARAERGEGELHGPEPGLWVEALEQDHDNLRAAWALGVEHDGEMALALAVALSPFWRLRGLLEEGQERLRGALAAAGHGSPLRARGLLAVGVLASMRGDLAAAEPALRQCLDMPQSRAEAETGAKASSLLAFVAGLTGDPRPALATLQEAVEVAHAVEDRRALTMSLALCARVQLLVGDLAAAQASFDDCIRWARQEQQATVVADAVLGLGRVALAAGDYGQAQELVEQGVTSAQGAGDRYGVALGRAVLGELAWRRCEDERAGHELDAALALARDLGAPFPLALCLRARGHLAHAQDDTRAAASLFDQGVEVADAAGLHYVKVRCLLGRGEVAVARGERSAARAAFDEALALAEAVSDTLGVAESRHWVAVLARDQGDREHAVALHHQAVAVQRERGDAVGMAASLEALAGLATAAHAAHAARLMGAAQSAREARGARRRPMECPFHAEDLERLRTRLGPTEFASSWAQGAALSIDEAASLALRGQGRRSQALTGWDSLTGVQRDVAGLVAEGLTNKEVAERLYMSPRTVQGHLLGVFSKLGIRSRRQLRDMADGTEASDPDTR